MTDTLQGWHLRKEVTVGQILTILAVAGGAVTWFLSLENRVSDNIKAIENTKKEFTAATKARNDVVDIQLSAQRDAVLSLNSQLSKVVDALQQNTQASAVNSEKLNGIIRRMDERRRERSGSQ